MRVLREILAQPLLEVMACPVSELEMPQIPTKGAPPHNEVPPSTPNSTPRGTELAMVEELRDLTSVLVSLRSFVGASHGWAARGR
jgi:hypothetical protein